MINSSGTLHLQLAEDTIDESTHIIVDGVSAQQLNSFDCGVFAMANVERYVLDDYTLISQNTMKLYRCRYLSQLYELGIAVGVV